MGVWPAGMACQAGESVTARDRLLFWLARQVLDRLLRGSPAGAAHASKGECLLAEARVEATDEGDGRG